MNKRIRLAGIFFTAALIFLALRIGWLKVIYGEEYEAAAISQKMTDVSIPAQRGTIYDANGNILAQSLPVFDIILEPITLSEAEDEDVDHTFSVLSETAGISLEELYSSIEKDENGGLIHDTYYLPIARGISAESAKKLESAGLTGVWLEQKESRIYPFGVSACHITGFKKGVNSFGLENSYDDFLTGKDGRMVRQYENGTSQVIYYEPEDGCSLISTIDINIQKTAEEGVAEAMETFPCETASVLVMDPNTGEILASASSDVFDPNDPTVPVDEAVDLEAFYALDSEGQAEILNGLWHDFNISSTFEPGSIFKPMLVCGALDENIVSTESEFYCQGYVDVADRRIHCIRRTGHGSETLRDAIVNSCNSVMMEIAQREGAELFYKYQRDFGFGSMTGVDLPFETGASTLLYPLEELGPVELATGSIGQSFNCTPIQALTAFCAIANGGKILKPYAVSKVMDQKGRTVYENSPTLVRTVISEETCDVMNEYLKAVVDEGTGKKAKIQGYSIAGKSGTGEQGDRTQDRYTITFIGYFPADDPKAAMLVVIDKPEEYADGVTTAAPVFGSTAEKILKYMNISPDEEDHVLDEGSISVPDLTGLSAGDAAEKAQSLGLICEAVGESDGNTVSSQFPMAGEKAEEGSVIFLYFK